MNAASGWALAALAIVAGYFGWGWRGVVLALTLIAFWLLLQFSRALRALRTAASRPMGSVESAVMLHARLHAGMPLAKVVNLTRSLGQRVSEEPEAYLWRDLGGDAVQVEMRQGLVSAWALQRHGEAGIRHTGQAGGQQGAP